MKKKTMTTSEATFSLLKSSEGGETFASVKARLENAGVTGIRRAESPYVGQYAFIVPARYARRAYRVVFGR